MTGDARRVRHNLRVGAIVVVNHAESVIAAAVNELQRASYAVEAVLIGYIAIPTLHETDEVVAQLDLTILGALDHGELVRILGYRRTEETVVIDRLAVHPRVFRRGVGGSLLEELHRRERDALRFEVMTGAENTPAVSLYTKFGYCRAFDESLAEGVTLAHFIRE